jgi:hypothetical protein
MMALKTLIIKILKTQPTGLGLADSGVTGQNSLFRIWLKYNQNLRLEKQKQLRFGIVALFMRNILGTFWGTLKFDNARRFVS